MKSTTRTRVNILKDKAFGAFGWLCTMMALSVLALFLGFIVYKGIGRVNWQFITSLPSRKPELAGIYTALMGTVWVVVTATLIAIPVGVGAAIYLEEFAKKNRFSRYLESNINNLAGIPSIIYGLLGLEIFVRLMNMGSSIIAGALTLSLLMLPIIIVATREAIKVVPKDLRTSAYALGASKWQTIRYQVLPTASGGILTGIILAMARVLSEAAPLIVIGALIYVPFVPESPLDDFSVLPIQIFNWISRPQKGFIENAAAACLVLLLLTFLMNGLAIYLRYRWQKKKFN